MANTKEPTPVLATQGSHLPGAVSSGLAGGLSLRRYDIILAMALGITGWESISLWISQLLSWRRSSPRGVSS